MMADEMPRPIAGNAIRPVAADGVHVGGGDDLGDLVPRRTDEAAFPPLGLVAPGPHRILDHLGPRLDGIARAPERLPIELEQ